MLYMIDKNLELYQEIMSSDNSENTYDNNNDDNDNDRLFNVKYISNDEFKQVFSVILFSASHEYLINQISLTSILSFHYSILIFTLIQKLNSHKCQCSDEISKKLAHSVS